jgi:choline-sulfatase
MTIKIKVILLITIFVLFVGGVYFYSYPLFSHKISTSTALCGDCNVIIIGLDALGAAHVSHLGNKNETTPTVDLFAKQGTSFSNAISAAPWTVPSFMSIFTGLFPTEHKVLNKFSSFTEEKQVVTDLRLLSPQVETLAEIFKKNGYVTGGFTGDAGVSGSFGYSKGFDIYTDETTFGSIKNSSIHALSWIKENKDKKMFIFLHGYDNHGQYNLPKDYVGKFQPKEYKGTYRGTAEEQRVLREQGLRDGRIILSADDVSFWRGWYDSKIRDTDSRLAVFWEEYKKLGLDKKTIIVIVSDHGTEFYEHGRFDHGFSLYDELVHVPLVFVVPGMKGKGLVAEQVSTLDISPTLIDLTGIVPGPVFTSQQRGRSLINFLTKGKSEAKDVFIETNYRDYTYKRGIRTSDGWKYVLTMEDNSEELYKLSSDKSELKNVLKDYPAVSEKLKNKVLSHVESMGGAPEGGWKTGCIPVYGDQCK